MILAALAAAGLAIFVTGLPVWRDGRLRALLRPYLAPSDHREPPRRTLLLATDRRAALVERLRAAGSRQAPEGVWLQLWASAAAGSLVGVLVVLSLERRGEIEPLAALLVVICFGGCGYALRDRALSHAARRRISDMTEVLPTATDLLVVAIMSGESIFGAFERVAAVVGGPLGDEFRSTVAATKAGGDLQTALAEMARRVPHPAMARMTSALITALETGAPTGDVLIAQAADLRIARRAEMMEAGGRREVLMLVPVVFLILPVVVVFALFPGLVTLDLLVP